MSRARFVVILLLVALLVGLGAFAGALQVLDDGEPDPPPRADSSVTSGAPSAEGSTTVPTTASPPPSIGMAAPTWVAVIASETSEEAAHGKADPVAAKGYPTGVLHSDDYGSLKPGLWVAYAGPYPNRGAAGDAVETLAADGFSGAYSRCVGTEAQCRGDD